MLLPSITFLCTHPPAQAINDGVGLVVHSLLLVPYYSWKHSHRRHHILHRRRGDRAGAAPPEPAAGARTFPAAGTFTGTCPMMQILALLALNAALALAAFRGLVALSSKRSPSHAGIAALPL